MRYLFIDRTTVQLRDEPPLTLDRMQALVGGHIEQIWATEQRSEEEPRLVVIDNEEGVLDDLPPTVRFPRVYSVGGVLRGPVLIMGIDTMGDQADLTDAQLASVIVHGPLNPGDPFPTLHIRE